MISDSAAVADPAALSVTLTVKFADPGPLGVPDMVPLAPRLSPAGSDPLDTDHEYGGDPPDALSVCEYATPTVPAGSADVVIPRAGGLMISESAVVAEPVALSVTFTVKFADPALPGVPDIVPPADRLRPAGNDPPATDHEYGGDPPDAPSGCEYATPTVPAGSDDVVIRTGGGSTVNDNAFVALPPPLSVNLTVKFAVPPADGVPLITPVDAARLKPCGKLPCDIAQVTGGIAPAAASVAV